MFKKALNKLFFIFILLLSINCSIFADGENSVGNIDQTKKLEEVKLLADKSSILFSHLVWNMDNHSIMLQLEEMMGKYQIPAIIINDISSDQTYSVWRKKGKILYGKNIDIKEHLDKTLKPITRALTYRGKNLGNIQIFLEFKNDLEFSDREKKYLEQKKVLNYCLIPNLKPFEKIDKNGEYQSITTDYIKIIENKTGIKTNMIKEESLLETLSSLRNKKCDMVLGIASTKSRNTYLLFSDPFLNYPYAVVTRLDSNYIRETNDILDMRVGVLSGYAIGEILGNKYKDLHLRKFENPKEAFKNLAEGKIDCFIGILPLISNSLTKYNSMDLKIAGQLDERIPLSAASRIDEPLLNSILNKVLNSISDQEHKYIMNKWIKVQFEKDTDYGFVWKILIVVIIIIAIVFYWNLTLKKEIESRKQIEHKLALAKQKAEEASRSKSSFLANMSHEIRTPMNAVIGMNTLALKHVQNKMAKDYITKSLASAKSLLGIINDILDFSKIEAGKLHIESIPFHLKEKIENTCDIFNYAIMEKDINLYIKIDEKLSKTYKGDPLRIGQILSNFLSNAVKFTLSGSITVSARMVKNEDNKDMIYFSVADTGMGIGENKLDSLFDSFEQEDISTTRNYGGTGLGLAICKKLVNLMDGTIGVTSTIGVGSTFYFKIPLEISDEKIEEEKEKKPKLLKDKKNKKFVSNAKVLLVEDFHINVEVAVAFLKEMVGHIDVAKNGKEAVEILEKKGEDHYNSVLMDIQMPVMDGYEATQYIRETLKFTKLPIIAMSANAMESDIEECMEKGMNDHIPKPFDASDLLNKLTKWILTTKK